MCLYLARQEVVEKPAAQPQKLLVHPHLIRSRMHIAADNDKFLDLYTQFSVTINFMFLLLGNMVLVLGVTMALIHGEKFDEK